MLEEQPLFTGLTLEMELSCCLFILLLFLNTKGSVFSLSLVKGYLRRPTAVNTSPNI